MPGDKAVRLWRPRIGGLIGFATLLIYVGWIGGPYLRSIIIRDAAVTTWISVASSPISGYVDTRTLHPGTRIGPDRRISTVKNPLVDGTPVAKAQADLDRAKEHIAALQGLAADLQASADVRALEAADFAAAFKLDLDQRIAAAGNNMASIRNRLGLERVQSDRMARLLTTGHASQSAADVAAGLVMESERALTNVQAEFDRATLRRAAAERGVLLLDDAEDGAVALRSLEDIRLSLARTTLDLAVAKAEADHAEAILAQARGNYERARLEHIEAPAGSMVWSLIASPGEAVQPGSPIVSWIDCNIMLVDVPVSDVELALLSPGSVADVVLEGERHVRHGTVFLKRGAAATIGQTDLAAVAKGRHPGIGQVLVKLDHSPIDVEACPIGAAAYVDFPEVGLFDILSARLRL